MFLRKHGVNYWKKGSSLVFSPTPQGILALIVGGVALGSVWAVILWGLASEKRNQAKNSDEH